MKLFNCNKQLVKNIFYRFKLRLTALMVIGCVAFVLSPLSVMATGNEECMGCHGDPGLTREEPLGGIDNIVIDGRNFKYSVHNINGITCVDCHADIEELNFDDDVPHEKMLNAVNCAGCHEEENMSYAKSVHSRAQRKGMNIKCSACHGSHYVTSMVDKPVLERENSSCLKCHNPYSFHEWLPQKETHFSYVQCTVCHAPDAPRHIHLRFYDLVKKDFMNADSVLDALGVDIDGFMPLLSKDDDKLSVEEFENMVFMLKQRGVRVSFHGELLSEREAMIHQVNKGKWEGGCEGCHMASSDFFESVAIFFSSGDGTMSHFEVDRKVLESYSVNNFYVPGGTRIRELDLVGVFLVAGAVLGISGHLLARAVTFPIRKRRREEEMAAKGKVEK